MKYNLTETKPMNQSVVKATYDSHLKVGSYDLHVETYASKAWDNTFRAVYHIGGDFGFAGSIGFKNFSVNAKATPEEAYEAVVCKAERWIAKYLEN